MSCNRLRGVLLVPAGVSRRLLPLCQLFSRRFAFGSLFPLTKTIEKALYSKYELVIIQKSWSFGLQILTLLTFYCRNVHSNGLKTDLENSEYTIN